MKNSIMIAIALCLTACGGSSKSANGTGPKAADTASGPVELTFDWPVGVSGSVKRDQYEQIDDKIEQSSVVYTITTEPVDEGLQLTYSDPREISLEGVSEQQIEGLKPMFHAVPTIIFSDGAIVSIGNVEAMRAIVDQLAPIPPNAPTDVKARLEQTRSEEFFLNAARSEWATITTVWHGQSLEPGAEVTAETETQLLGLQAPVQTTIRMKLVERLPCPGAADTTCVRLTYSSTPDSASLKTASEWIAHEAARNGVKFEVNELTREYEVELVTDPATLLPYHFSSNEVTKLSAVQAGTPVEKQRIKRRTETYDWD